MLQAMNTGHQGSMTTIHANSPRDAMIRLENMVSLAGIKVGIHPIRRQIASAINVVIQVARLSDGTRKVLSVQEITGMEGDMIEMQEIFSYEQHGLSAEGRVNGAFVASGIRPRFAEHIAREGYQLPDHLFVPPVQ